MTASNFVLAINQYKGCISEIQKVLVKMLGIKLGDAIQLTDELDPNNPGKDILNRLTHEQLVIISNYTKYKIKIIIS